jgi:hypothetical protein
MALVINDRVKETSTSTGASTFTLAGAQTGFDTFAAGIGGNNTTYYAIFNQGTNEWEVGLGTLNAGGTVLTRTTILTSSNSDNIVTFTSGTKDVFCTLHAKWTPSPYMNAQTFVNTHATTLTQDQTIQSMQNQKLSHLLLTGLLYNLYLSY